jgi:hypothetical protein
MATTAALLHGWRMEQEELDVVPQETQGSAVLGPAVEEIWIQPPAHESPLEGCSVLTAGLGGWRHCGGRWRGWACALRWERWRGKTSRPARVRPAVAPWRLRCGTRYAVRVRRSAGSAVARKLGDGAGERLPAKRGWLARVAGEGSERRSGRAAAGWRGKGSKRRRD